MVFPLNPIEKANRDMDNAFMIDHLNHKFAIKFEDEFLPMIKSEYRRGFGLVPPLNSWSEIPNCTIAPLGMVEQGTINNTRFLVKKQCVTHEQSLSGPIGISVNRRVVATTIMACFVFPPEAHHSLHHHPPPASPEQVCPCGEV
jgi:hypothetical protein